ncbi:MAG: alkaline phosphatase family protein [Candidatus Acidiferrales bacterium]
MLKRNVRWLTAIILAANLVVALPASLFADQGQGGKNPAGKYRTTTPIKHIVIIFQENESFDHYFGTYPNATNPKGETRFNTRPGTPSVNGLNNGLQNKNPNGPTYQPFRLDPSQNYTCDQTHRYTPEQQAFDSGLMDKFPQFTAVPCTQATAGGALIYPSLAPLGPGVVMGYYDGNTVTALWNYAQYFSMSDNFHGSTFGPSAVGAINLASGMTGNVNLSVDDSYGDLASDVVNNTIVGDPDPWYEDCVSYDQAGLAGKNIGDLLNAKNISWGWFQGGFTPSTPYNPGADGNSATPAQSNTTTNRLDGTPETAYAGYHNPFQFYASTNNKHHIAPESVEEVGHNGPANHIYDLKYFWKAAFSGNLPAVSFLKANRAQDGHPGNSSPLDEQQWITDTLNKLQSLDEWNETAVFIAWDDSDGWYDHAIGPIMNQSASTADALTGPGACGTGANSLAGIQARCGYGPRLPLVLVSLYARENYVDGTVLDQSSIIRFIEDNWGLGRIGDGSFDAIAGSVNNMFDFNNKRHDRLFLDTTTGQVAAIQH